MERRRYPILESLYPPRDPAPALRARGERQALVRPSVTPHQESRTLPEGARVMAPGDLVEFMVYGVDDEDQTQEVHLAFREEVVQGVYLKLRFEPAGVRAIFIVRDTNGRRWAAAYGEQILARLSQRGLRTQHVDIEEQVP
ncbi:MAG: hypothetical protein ABIJ09_25350 [Pseudomonadota bacterium]